MLYKKHNMKTYIIIILILMLTSAASAQPVNGKPAPPLTAYKWLKGKRVTSFQKGKIYVIEFGATWCSPCAAAIPELSALAEKHKDDVQVISFFVMEQLSRGSGAYGDNVIRYVKKRGEQMQYTVALDDEAGTMQKTWLAAAGKNGIPYAFIVDRAGNMVWSGNSVKEMERQIELLLTVNND